MIFKRHFLYLEILPILNLNNGHELGQTLGDGEGQGGLACCSPWSHKESDITLQLDNSNKYLAKNNKNFHVGHEVIEAFFSFFSHAVYFLDLN